MVKTVTKVGEAHGWLRAEFPAGTRHPDGLYSTLGGERLLIDGGVLFLPMELLGPDVEFGWLTRLVMVKSEAGERLMFVRAKDCVALRPGVAGLVGDVARVYGCSL
jgi:hypothetical protein